MASSRAPRRKRAWKNCAKKKNITQKRPNNAKRPPLLACLAKRTQTTRKSAERESTKAQENDVRKKPGSRIAHKKSLCSSSQGFTYKGDRSPQVVNGRSHWKAGGTESLTRLFEALSKQKKKKNVNASARNYDVVGLLQKKGCSAPPLPRKKRKMATKGRGRKRKKEARNLQMVCIKVSSEKPGNDLKTAAATEGECRSRTGLSTQGVKECVVILEPLEGQN